MRVCYKLRREIEGLFPPKTTAAERLVGCFIADRARRATRIAMIKPEDFDIYTGLGTSGLNDAFMRLRDRRGLEFRVVIGKDHNNHPVYAFKGVPPQYRVPEISEFKDSWIACGDPLVTRLNEWFTQS